MHNKKLTTNVLLQIAYQIISLIVPFVTAPYITRIFSAALTGEQSYSVTIAHYFMMFSMLGINNLGSRNIAKVKSDKKSLDYEFSRMTYCHAIISILVLGAYFIFLVLFKTDYPSLYYIGSLYVISSLLDINWLYFGLEEFKITVTRNVVIKIISIICIFCFINKPSDLWKYALILAASTLFSNIYLWLILPKYTKFVKVRLPDMVSIIKPMLVLFIPVVAVSIYRQMDKIMLAILASTEELGYYEQSEKIINLGTQVMTSVGVVMMPRFSELYSKGKKEEADNIIRLSNLFSAVFSCAISFGLIAVGNVLAEVYLGDMYLPCGALICLLSPVVVVMSYANVVRTHYLIPQAKDRPYVISAIAGAVFNFIINVTLIGILGAKGAIVGTLVAEVIVCIIQCYYSKDELPLVGMVKDYFPFVIIGVFMTVLLRVFYRYNSYTVVNLISGIVIGAFVYIALSCAYLYLFRKKEFTLLISNILKKRGKNNV